MMVVHRFLIKLILIITIVMLGSCASKKYIEIRSGLKYTILRPGKGETAQVGQEVLIHEKMGYRNDSLVFSSYGSNPVKFLIGGNQVVEGVDSGVRGMKKNEIRKIIVPTTFSNRRGNHSIPHPDSTLVYEIELLDILN